jgi:hypothetical protein
LTQENCSKKSYALLSWFYSSKWLVWDKYQDAVRVTGYVTRVARPACVRTEGQHAAAFCTRLTLCCGDKGGKAFN